MSVRSYGLTSLNPPIPIPFHDEFTKSTFTPWPPVGLEKGKVTREVMSANGGRAWTAGNVTFVKVYDAG